MSPVPHGPISRIGIFSANPHNGVGRHPIPRGKDEQMMRRRFFLTLMIMLLLIVPGMVSGRGRDTVDVYTDSFESGVFNCTGPLGDNMCWQTWESLNPLSSGMPAACHGTFIAWHEFETCNFPHGPDHLLIMNGTDQPEHDMTDYLNIEIQLQWYQNTSMYGETVEIYVADALFSTLDCNDLSAPWELIYSETNQLSYAAGACDSWSVSLPEQYDNATSLVVAIRYIGMDGDSVGLDKLTLVAEQPSQTPTPTPPSIPSTTPSGVILLLSGLTILLIHTRQKKDFPATGGVA